jgi:hypothetical protein
MGEHGRVVCLDVLVEAQGPGAARFNSEASIALRVSNGSRRRSSPSSLIRSKAYRITLVPWRR